MGDDWDLQAVVRSCTTATTSSSTATVDDSFSCFSPLVVDQKDPLLSFPDLFETRTATEELEELCKPFFPKSDPLSPQRISTSLLALGGVKDQPQQQQTPQQQKQTQRPLSGSGTAAAAATNTTHSQTPRSKRRKNQQKRVVCQVPAEGLSSDMWAWRKYGQKPIKGSPYPRGYYRCSSSKGCLARKQVERSCSDPGIFIITYTAEHNHPIPTHRNSLAGSTRNKFPPPQNTGVEPETSTGKPSCSSPASTTTAGLSPMTPSTAAMEDELLQQTKPESREDDEEEMVEDNEDDDLLIPDMLMDDDLFNDLGELAGPTSATASSAGPGLDDCYPDNLPATFPPPWFAHNAATAAGGG